MKRGYRFREVVVCFEKLARLGSGPLGVYVGMDVITGFPGETDETFEEAFKRLEFLPWTQLHVFPYSEREGTPATRLENSVPPAVRTQRAQRLIALSTQRSRHAEAQWLGRACSNALIEHFDGHLSWGHLPNYYRVGLAGEFPVGEFAAGTVLACER